MGHGPNCDCGLCKLGKKMGMIKSADKHDHDHSHDHDHDHDHECENCK